MARELFGRRTALLTAALTATTFWHLNLSRVGFRAVSLPLFTALCLWCFARGLRRQCWHDFVCAGLFLGLGMYTYLAARFLPIVFMLLVPYWLLRRQWIHWRGLLVFFFVALIVAAPLLLYAFQHLDTFLARSEQVSIFNPAINQGQLAETLTRQLLSTLGMFNWRGDFIPRHNLPYRPVFDPLIGLFFLLGLAIALRRALRRQEPRWRGTEYQPRGCGTEYQYALPLLYLAVMLTPTVLAEGAPHFLRASGVLPVLFVFPAVGLETTWQALHRRTGHHWASWALAMLLCLSLAMTVNDYFRRHVGSEAVYYNFETGASELAADIGGSIEAKENRVYLDSRLWRDWASLRYLIPDSDRLLLLAQDVSAPQSAGAVSPSVGRGKVWVVVWPFADQSQHLALLPQEHLISVWEGPLERGDLEKEPRLLCVIYEAAPLQDIPHNIGAQFEQGIQLLGYQLQVEPLRTRVRLFWKAEAALGSDYTAFIHWRRGEQTLTQSDSYPTQGRYPTHLWRPGDVIADEHVLAATLATGTSDSLLVGLYQWQTMQRLQVLDPSGSVVADAVSISLP
jgi:4-amino-4-deoxy-L-arabinose transferase-like glycosyltransferase